MSEAKDKTHYVGDDCPGGHRDMTQAGERHDRRCEECGKYWPYTGRWCDRCFGNIRRRFEKEQKARE